MDKSDRGKENKDKVSGDVPVIPKLLSNSPLKPEMDISKEGIKNMKETFREIFWEGIERDLLKKDKEDGLQVTQEQKILRALVVLNYRVKDLEKMVNLDEKVMKKLWLPADKSILIEDVEKIVDETALAFISVDGVIAVKLYKKELKQKLKEKCT